MAPESARQPIELPSWLQPPTSAIPVEGAPVIGLMPDDGLVLGDDGELHDRAGRVVAQADVIGRLERARRRKLHAVVRRVRPVRARLGIGRPRARAVRSRPSRAASSRSGCGDDPGSDPGGHGGRRPR